MTKSIITYLPTVFIKGICLILLLLIAVISCSKSNENDDTPIGSGTVPTPNQENSTNTDDNTVNFDFFEGKFENLMTRLNMQGAQVAITKDEKLVYLKSFGRSNVPENQVVTDNSLFRIASISKPITVLAILKLVSQDKLELSDKVFGANAILGSDYGTLDYSSLEQSITVMHLLEHKSGFTNEPYDIMFDDISLTHKDLIDDVLDNREVRHTPGSRYYYSNFGYCLLGRIIEKVTGKGYEEYVIDEILKPMGILDMRIGGNTLSEKYENEVTYYSSWFNPYQMNVNRMDSHGGWIASAKDLAKFAAHTDTRPVVMDLLNISDMKLYFENGSWGHNGALPGTSSIINVGQFYSFAVIFNGGSSNFEFEQSETSKLLNEEIQSRKEWPSVDLFD